MYTVIITGVCGFIGTELSEYLSSNNFNIIGLDIKESNHRLNCINSNYQHHILDLNNIDSINSFFSKITFPNLVIHLAGITRVKDASINPHQAIKTNILATVNLFLSYQNFCHANSKSGSFLFISTSELENTSFSSGLASVYSTTKYCAEELIKVIHDPKIISTSILRLCTVYGGELENNDKLPRIFLEKIKRNQHIVINSDISINPSFIFINDLLLIIEKFALDMLTTNNFDNVFQTCTVFGQESSLGEIIRHMENILDKNIDFSYSIKNSSDLLEKRKDLAYNYKIIRPYKPVNLSEGLKISWSFVNKDFDVT